MDAKKNKNKEQKPASIEMPEVQPMTQIQEIPMQEMPITEQSTSDDQPMDFMDSNCWHCPIMSEQQPEVVIPMSEETQGADMPMDEINMEEDINLSEPRFMRGYFEDYNDYGFNHYDYRVYADVDDIMDKIMRYNPGIFRRLASFGVPFPEARNIVRRIIRQTLNNNR